jgi:FHS family L-fucose permease-like MFS transporter
MGLSEDRAAHYLSFYWGGLMIGRLMGAVSLGGIQQSRKGPLMILAAVLSTLVIFANATFKEKFTTGHFINPAEVVPYVLMVLGLLGCFVRGGLGPEQMIGWFALIAAGLTAVAMGTGGSLALWSIVGIGLFNSIMWSNIFTLSIRGLGKDTAQGSSLLVMMIVGGALMPALQGKLMDWTGVRLSLGIVLVGYAYLAWFGWVGSRMGRDKHHIA